MEVLTSPPVEEEVGWQQSLVEAGGVPDSLRLALQSEEVRAVTLALIEELTCDPRELPRCTPVACPGAPYSRNKSTA